MAREAPAVLGLRSCRWGGAAADGRAEGGHDVVAYGRGGCGVGQESVGSEYLV